MPYAGLGKTLTVFRRDVAPADSQLEALFENKQPRVPMVGDALGASRRGRVEMISEGIQTVFGSDATLTAHQPSEVALAPETSAG